MPKKNRKSLNKVVLLIISIVFIIVFVRQFGNLSEAIETLAKGNLLFLVAIFLIQFVGIINRGGFYYTLYDFFGVKDSVRRLTLLSVASNFLNLAAPAAGLSGIALFVGEAERQGMSKSRSILVNLFAYFLIYAVFVVVLLFGLFYLFFNSQLYTYQLVTAGILFGMVLVLTVVFFVALKGAARLNKLLTFVVNFINYVLRIFQANKILIKEGQVHILSSEISDCLKTIKEKLPDLKLTVLHVFLMEIIDILTLYYIFLAFGYPINIGVLITAYAICMLFSLISITPGGVGVVEATMILMLTNLQVPVELATIAVIAYRFFTFWLPFFPGYFAFRNLQKQKIIELENGAS